MIKKSLTALGAIIAFATTSHASVILALDFNSNNRSFADTADMSPTYSAGGFTGWNLLNQETLGSTAYTVGTFGDYEVSFRAASNAGGSRDRLTTGVTVSDTVSDFYRDFARTTAATAADNTILPTGNAAASLIISGFEANTSYTLQLWSYDHTSNGGRTYRYFDMNNGSGTLLGTVTNTTGSMPSDLTGFTITGTVSADDLGRIVIGTTASAGNEVAISGFTVSAVPEPSVYAALVGLLVTGFAIIRRRKA